ncbi:MerR family transcriptional regulator [Nonomuraea terrae]|uniref:helix-turn-helix domain-containing protein n=1 Tax=Nonomuraea terrae TaxID=2530383 RepID=UPI001CB74566|nr:helix-turn-helix domain-containing protein [Nonomuraea terrae]
MSDTWTIGELAEHAARALRSDAPPPASGRVRDVPGERLIRWYTTIGLVDPPLARRGRVARYGRRHLLQLVAVKRLQAAGHSIAEIQTALAGATDRMLETAARLPLPDQGPPALTDQAPPALTDQARPAVSPSPGRAPSASSPLGPPPTGGAAEGPAGDGQSRGRFWAERPETRPAPRAPTAGTPAAGTPAASTAPDALKTRRAPARAGDAWRPPRSATVPAHRPTGAGQTVTGIRLGERVRIVLDTARALSEEDVQAVLAAAGPLLAVLEERKLL